MQWTMAITNGEFWERTLAAATNFVEDGIVSLTH
jgi:hypothetical protein